MALQCTTPYNSCFDCGSRLHPFFLGYLFVVCDMEYSDFSPTIILHWSIHLDPLEKHIFQAPKRIASKVLVTNSNNKHGQKIQVSKVWNCLIIAMYREHFLSIEQVHRLLYEFTYTCNDDGNVVIREPTFSSHRRMTRSGTPYSMISRKLKEESLFRSIIINPNARHQRG